MLRRKEEEEEKRERERDGLKTLYGQELISGATWRDETVEMKEDGR